MMLGRAHAREMQPVYARFAALVEAADGQVRARPDDPEPALARAALLEEWGDLDRALPGYRQAAERWPQEERGWLGEGRILFQLNRLDQAMPSLARALALNAGNDEARRLLDQARLRTGNNAALASMDLRGLQLQNRELPPGDYTGRDFSGARLSRVSLRESDLSGSRMAGVDLYMVDFSRSRLRNVAMTGARSYQLNLTDADLQGADLTRSGFQGVQLLRSNLDGLVGIGANFEQSRIEQSRFVGANLEGASFSTSRLAGVDFSGARLDGANLRAARLVDVNLATASLAGADMRGVIFDCRTQFPPGFDPLQRRLAPSDRSCFPPGTVPLFDDADFTRTLADFSGLDLHGASFRGARLHGVNLRDANLEGADFSGSSGAGVGAFLRGANLINANLATARNIDLSGARFDPRSWPGVDGYSYVLRDIRFNGATLDCGLFAGTPAGPQRDAWLDWILRFQPRQRGVGLAENCSAVPELAGLR